ncbi:MAG: SAP domain-containing protein [Lachnospiraceae bacterium]|nr:SAP domain-containing protein [Lachnospiraceae bacterium]
MSFLDFFRRKPKSVQNKKSFLQNKVTTADVKQPKANISSFIKVTTEIIPSVAEEIVQAEKRIQNAIASKHGLYPHEVLVLDYASSYYTEGNSFQGFWWYRYGVRDVDKCLHSLLDRGFLQVGNLQSAIGKETVAVLKEELKKYGLKMSGKKDELVQRLMAEVSHDELNSRFAKRTYQLTELGKQALEEEDYVPYIHRHALEDLDIWSLNRIIHEPPYMPYRDKIWGYLNKRSMEHFAAGNFGLYRNCRYHMYDFLMEEKKINDALGMISEVVFYDLSSLGNNYDPQYLDIFAEHFFPYKDSTVTMAPGITSAVIHCQEELNLSDEDLKTIMLDRMNHLSAPLHLFKPEECVDIVLMESREDIDGLTKIYAKAKRRFKQRFPGIKC